MYFCIPKKVTNTQITKSDKTNHKILNKYKKQNY